MGFCTQCGSRFEGDERFCTQCGAPREEVAPSVEETSAAEETAVIAGAPAAGEADAEATAIMQPLPQSTAETPASQPAVQPVALQDAAASFGEPEPEPEPQPQQVPPTFATQTPMPAPIPASTPASSPAPAKTPRRGMLAALITVIVVLVVLVGLLAWSLVPGAPIRGWLGLDKPGSSEIQDNARHGSSADSDDDMDDEDDDEGRLAVSICSSAPKIDLERFHVQDDDLIVTVRFTNSCSASSKRPMRFDDDAVRITLTDSSTSDRLADAVFDFSDDPIEAEAGDDATRRLVFDDSQFWFVPDTRGSSVSSINISCTPRYDGALGESGDSADDADAGRAVDDEEERETAAKAALDAQVEHDRATVNGFMTVFTTQLSSKKKGMVINGHEWNYQDIWQHYLSIKLAHPKTLLVWSGDWPTYQRTGTTMYYVMISGESFASADDAWAWCSAEGYGQEDCLPVDMQ